MIGGELSIRTVTDVDFDNPEESVAVQVRVVPSVSLTRPTDSQSEVDWTYDSGSLGCHKTVTLPEYQPWLRMLAGCDNVTFWSKSTTIGSTSGGVMSGVLELKNKYSGPAVKAP